MRPKFIDRSGAPHREELVCLAEQSRDHGLSVPKVCFELRREVMRRKALRTAALVGLQLQEVELILKVQEKEKDHKRCTYSGHNTHHGCTEDTPEKVGNSCVRGSRKRAS